jgi:cupin fold WbuC family metalloprotein
MLERIIFEKELFAIIIRAKSQFKKKGVNFITSQKDSLQLGFLKHPKNHEIQPHAHKKKNFKIKFISEFLFIKKGELKVFFYSYAGKNINKDKILKKNDIIILLKGGHGFKIKKNSEIIEIKQGPYLKANDKILFE